ncbi:MAG: hypothetical protein WC346_15865 [Methanogenium sp.]|jgi:hypothetical protein
MWQNLLFILAGAVIACGISVFLAVAWKKGFEYATRLYLPPAEPLPPTPEQLRAEKSKITCNYDILFDSDITTHFASGISAFNWGKIYEDIVNHVGEYAKDLDKNVKTIIVRSIRINKQGRPEFSFEPIVKQI